MNKSIVRGGQPVDEYGRPIPIHGPEAFEKMREAGNLAARCLDMITPEIIPGVSTQKIDDLVHAFIIDNRAVPATLGYRGYPKSCCTSVNEVICHGIPAESEILKEKDIINVDVTVILDGWYGDTSRMFIVGGKTFGQRKKLVDATFDAMWAGINQVKPGATLGDVGAAIQKVADKGRFSVVTEFAGHGVGQQFHEPPTVVHTGQAGAGVVLHPGMIFTIEPMLNVGKPGSRLGRDGWRASTRDGKPSAQFEHTIGVTNNGFEVFTLSPKGLDRPS
ncbi:MAG: type I methionyl aminopeptidase [Alphaproteobacteria bacterium]